LAARIARLVDSVVTPHFFPQLVSPIMVPEFTFTSIRARNRHNNMSRSEPDSFEAFAAFEKFAANFTGAVADIFWVVGTRLAVVMKVYSGV